MSTHEAFELSPGRHLLLRWQPSENPNTVVEHRKVVDTSGSVWWGKIGDPARRALSLANEKKLRDQLRAEQPTHVYLYRPGELWRTTLIRLVADEDLVDKALVPSYYLPSTTHHLWLQLRDFVELPADWAEGHLTLASSGKPVTFTGQSSLFLVRETATVSDGLTERYFVLNTGEERSQRQYGDVFAERLGFDADVTGRIPLLSARRGRFVYYRTSKGRPERPSSFIGAGRITNVVAQEAEADGKQRWAAELADYRPFVSPVHRHTYSPPGWNVQHGIAEVSREALRQTRVFSPQSGPASGAGGR